MKGNQMDKARRGRLGRLGRQISTYAYARARDVYLASVFQNSKYMVKVALILPSLPSLPNLKNKSEKTDCYVFGLGSALPPIGGGLPPLPPTAVQYLAEQRK